MIEKSTLLMTLLAKKRGEKRKRLVLYLAMDYQRLLASSLTPYLETQSVRGELSHLRRRGRKQLKWGQVHFGLGTVVYVAFIGESKNDS